MRESTVKMPHAELFERALSGRLDEARAREIVQKAQVRYGELFAERERYSERALREHSEKNILPGVALYQTLLGDEDTRERAQELVEGVFRVWGVSSRRGMERLGRLPFFYGLMRIMIKPVMRLNFPKQGWETEWVEVSGKEISFNMQSCFYLDVLEGYGLPELTALYCLLDDLIYEGVSPYVRWARKQTLGRGDSCCDFRFERVERRR